MYQKLIVLVVIVMLLSFGTAIAFEIEPMAFQFLRSGTTDIGQGSGSGSVYLHGNTLAKQTVSRIEVTVVLQQFKNGAWVDIWSDSVVSQNASNATIDRLVPVQRGFYYRVYGMHRVTHSGVTEILDTQTSSVYVN